MSAAAASATACGRVWYATPSKADEHDLARERRPFEHEHERENHDEEERVEGVLGHDHAAVGERGKRDGEHRSEEREPLADETSREQIRRHRRERDQDGVDRLRGRIRVRDPVEESPGRADQQRVDDPVPAGRNVPKSRSPPAAMLLASSE